MSLVNTPAAERVHISFFGCRNAGKSSVINAVTAQKLSIVSDVKGTTTDPVSKTMEILPLGPVVITDTPGIDDEGKLGQMRVERTLAVLTKTDIAVLVVDAALGLCDADKDTLELIKQKKLPCIICYNKADLREVSIDDENSIAVSALTGQGINELKELIARQIKTDTPKALVSDLLQKGDSVVLVIPVDEAAPKGRLILPQQLVMRDLLDNHLSFVACQHTELGETLSKCAVKPKMVITDSQAFGMVSKVTPDNVMLTSFSILLARYKGNLASLVSGAATLSRLKDGDRVLISEGCTHHRQCNDIGTVKLPRWIEEFSGARPQYTFTSGAEFPTDLSGFSLVVHCGGCMINEKEMQSRIAACERQNVPIVNYGMAIAAMHKILKRSLQPFPDILALLND